MTQNIFDLQQRFSDLSGVKISNEQSELGKVQLENGHGKMEVYLQGAQLTSYHPLGGGEKMWLSQSSNFSPHKAIRGGAPICWPWFGQHQSNTTLPQHGFARTSLFQLDKLVHYPQGHSELTLSLESTTASLKLWPFQFKLTVTFNLAETLSIKVTTKNLSPHSMPLTQAIHSYFRVKDSRKIQIKGTNNCNYFDKVNNCMATQNDDDLCIINETDRIYYRENALIELIDEDSRLQLQHKGSDSSVIWNPWQIKAESMSDFDNDGFQHMLCVESAITSDEFRLSAGDSHELIQVIG